MGCLSVTFTRIGGAEATFTKDGGALFWVSQVCDVPTAAPRLRDSRGDLVLTSENETIILNEG